MKFKLVFSILKVDYASVSILLWDRTVAVGSGFFVTENSEADCYQVKRSQSAKQRF